MSRTEQFYYQDTKAAFFEGFCLKRGEKRISDTKYVKYHYFLPSNLMPSIKFLKKYFQQLDNPLPKERRRTSSMEYAEVALDALNEIRIRVGCQDHIILGSPELCPLPWAVVGASTQRLVRHTFPNLSSIIDHYRFVATHSRGFNVTSILMRQEHVIDKMAILEKNLQESPNLILSVGILFICDLIRNCGPDGREFMALFSNDKRQTLDDACKHWREIRKTLLPATPLPPNKVLGFAAAHVAVRSNASCTDFSNIGNYSKKVEVAYSHVEIEDFGLSASLFENEKTFSFARKSDSKEETSEADIDTEVLEEVMPEELEVAKPAPKTPASMWPKDDRAPWEPEKEETPEWTDHLAWLNGWKGQPGYDC